MKRCKILILLSVTLVHLASSGLAAGSVLCFGADGHVTLESSASGCCAKAEDDAVAPARSAALGSVSRDLSCGDCVDIALAASAGRTSPLPLAPARHLVVAVHPLPDLRLAPVAVSEAGARASGRPDAVQRRSLSSVVLRV